MEDRVPDMPYRKKDARARTARRRAARRQAGHGVTLENVAERAGVAPATVSRAINHPEKVARDTLERINRAIEQTGYLPNLLAGGLASSRSRLFAAIMPSIANLVYAETIQSFTRRIRENGYQVLLGESGYSQEEEEAVVAAVLGRRPDGIILIGINHSLGCRRTLLAAKIPVVEVWDITPTPLDMVIGYSHEAVGRAVAAYLHGKGYRRFGLVVAGDARAIKRGQAFEEELSRLGIAGELPKAVTPPGSSLQYGRRRMAEMLDAGFTGGAVFCSSDRLAHGVLIEAQARGLKVPEELAVIGFGDQDFAPFTYPALTTVRIDRVRMGLLAAEALLARVNDEDPGEAVVDLGFSIVERETA